MESMSESPNCVAVVVMGATGSGKSTFISLLADQDVEVSHGLQSHTIHGRPYSFQDPETGTNIMLMDMPGFDDTLRSDAENLRELSYSLAMLHRSSDVSLAGLVYLHRISDPRMAGSAVKNLRLFKALCGEQNYAHVVLATTMWTDIAEERVVGQQRERELRNTYWADMMQRGSQVKQHNGSPESALDIVRTLTRGRRPQSQSVTLAIQHELVVQGNTLDNTGVGRILSQEIDSDRARAARDVVDLESVMQEAEREGDRDAVAISRAEREAAETRAATLEENLSELRVGYSQLWEYYRLVYQRLMQEWTTATDPRTQQPVPGASSYWGQEHVPESWEIHQHAPAVWGQEYVHGPDSWGLQRAHASWGEQQVQSYVSPESDDAVHWNKNPRAAAVMGRNTGGLSLNPGRRNLRIVKARTTSGSTAQWTKGIANLFVKYCAT